MEAKVDRAGRLVIPKALREQLDIAPGCTLEIAVSGDGLTLRKLDASPALIWKDGILVHHGPDACDLDIVEFIRSERDARHAHIVRNLV